MHHLTPAARGLRTLFEVGSDRVWFAVAVAVGLFLASWLGQMALESLMILPEGGAGF